MLITSTNLGTGAARQVVAMLDAIDDTYFNAAPWDTVAQLAGCIDAPAVLPNGAVVWSRALQEPRAGTANR
jgi:hypothetical protein